MTISTGYIAFKNANTVTPIILTGGIATQQGGALPIVNLLNPTLANSVTPELDGQWMFDVLPGGTLIQNQYGQYPFANQTVAANSAIVQPNGVSVMMIAPAGVAGTAAQKLTTMTNLQNKLAQHVNQGGAFSVVTPAFIYTNGLLLSLRDVTGGDDKQRQFLWQLDFTFPLVSLAAAQQALNGLMTKLTNGTPTSSTPTWSGGAGLPVGNPTSLTNTSLNPNPQLTP